MNFAVEFIAQTQLDDLVAHTDWGNWEVSFLV